MPITEYIKRKFYDQLVSNAYDQVMRELRVWNEKRTEPLEIISKELSALSGIKVVPFYNTHRIVDLEIHLTASTPIKLKSAGKVFDHVCTNKFTASYQLNFEEDEVRLFFKTIGERRKLEFDEELQLAPDLLQYLYKTQYEDEATRFLEEYYPDSLKHPIPIDPKLSFEKMGLEVIDKPLSPDGSVRGKINFKEGATVIYDSVTKLYRKYYVSENTVLIDSSSRCKGSQNLTLIHEAYHYYAHKPHIVVKEYLSQCADYADYDKVFQKSVDWIEQQAKVIPPRILMPKDAFCDKAAVLISEISCAKDEVRMLDVFQQTIEQLAEFFQTSKTSVRQRLIELGYPEVRGVLEYVDGRYIANYAFNTEKVSLNQTLTLSKRQFMDLYLKDGDFRQLIDSKVVKYVDGHVVQNRKDLIFCVKFRGKELAWLKDKALANLDKYAVVFDIEKRYDSHFESEDDFTLYLLHPSSYRHDLVYRKGYENAPNIKQLKAMMEQRERENKLLRSLPNDFTMAMRAVKDYQKETYPKIAEGVGVSESTIKRIFDGQGSFQTFVFVLVYLELPDKVNEFLLGLSQFSVQNSNDEELLYEYILKHYQGQTVEAAKKFLEENGIKVE